MKYSKPETEKSLNAVRALVKPGDTIHTILRHVSRSGMSRNISPVLLRDGDTLHLSRSVAVILGLPVVEGSWDAVKIGGCGMDMGFSLVYNLSSRLFPDGYGCVGDRCPANDHSNDDRSYMPDGSVGGCQIGPQPCVCHDESSWTDGGYPDGCSACGCHRITHRHRDGGYALKQRWL